VRTSQHIAALRVKTAGKLTKISLLGNKNARYEAAE